MQGLLTHAEKERGFLCLVARLSRNRDGEVGDPTAALTAA